MFSITIGEKKAPLASSGSLILNFGDPYTIEAPPSLTALSHYSRNKSLYLIEESGPSVLDLSIGSPTTAVLLIFSMSLSLNSS